MRQFPSCDFPAKYTSTFCDPYPASRRKTTRFLPWFQIVFHGGPTNSGKTYQALQRLREADTGLYLAPLRLLAAEVYETLTAYGITTNLYTGQEKREVDSATHAAATIEMASTHDTQYDVVVLDEIQMIADESRGAAWTRALLALRCKEIHVCGGLEARHLIERIVESCGDDFKVITYDRYRPLQIADESLSLNPTEKGCYSKVSPKIEDYFVTSVAPIQVCMRIIHRRSELLRLILTHSTQLLYF